MNWTEKEKVEKGKKEKMGERGVVSICVFFKLIDSSLIDFAASTTDGAKTIGTDYYSDKTCKCKTLSLRERI